MFKLRDCWITTMPAAAGAARYVTIMAHVAKKVQAPTGERFKERE